MMKEPETNKLAPALLALAIVLFVIPPSTSMFRAGFNFLSWVTFLSVSGTNLLP